MLDARNTESARIPSAIATFEVTLSDLFQRFDPLAGATAERAELDDAFALYGADRNTLLVAIEKVGKQYARALPKTNDEQHEARRAFDPIAEAIRGLVKQVDLIYKLAARVADRGGRLASDEAVAAVSDRRAAAKLVKQLDEERRAAVEQMRHAAYFHRQVVWLQDRFPNAELQDVLGLVKLVNRAEIEAADWSLTPGRYVGVAPPEEDEDFDFEQTLRDIHTELADLNKEAAELAAKIQENFEELGA